MKQIKNILHQDIIKNNSEETKEQIFKKTELEQIKKMIEYVEKNCSGNLAIAKQYVRALAIYYDNPEFKIFIDEQFKFLDLKKEGVQQNE